MGRSSICALKLLSVAAQLLFVMAFAPAADIRSASTYGFGYRPLSDTSTGSKLFLSEKSCESKDGIVESSYSRKEWMTLVSSAALFSMSLGCELESAIAEDTDTAQSFSITKCSTASKAPCVSTANVRQLDLYLPPWTYDPAVHSAPDVMSRLKGAVASVDPSSSVMQQDDNMHLVVSSKRSNDLLGTMDTLEFIVNDVDHVVTFKSLASTENPDFGANRRRLEDIRQRAGIFGVMGSNLSSADSVSDGQRGNGPLGQLKAFYGLQSGAGYEDVILDR